MNKLLKILLSIAAVLLVATALLWTPDTSYSEMKNKYLTSDSQFIDLENGVRVHFRDFGNPQRNALVLIHGTSDSLLTWDAISPMLEQQYRLISLDLPGHGFSSAHPTADYSREQMSKTVVLLLDHLKLESASLMGNSLGGGIAWRTALDYPDRVEALVLLDPSGAPRAKKSKSNLGFRLLRTEFGRLIGRKITPRSLVQKSLTDTVEDPALVDDKITDRYWELLRLPGNRQALTELALQPWNETAWQNISQLTHPTLLVWGENDPLIPSSHADLFAAELENSQVLVYPGIGHLPMLELPEKLAEDVQNFLQQN